MVLLRCSSIAENASTVPLSQVAALQGRQLGRSLAGVLSGAAANLRSRLAGIADAGVRSGPRGSPSPPLNKKEDLVGFVIFVTYFSSLSISKE